MNRWKVLLMVIAVAAFVATGWSGEVESDISDDDINSVDSGWARTWGGSENDHGFGVVVDGTGNIYVTGDFTRTVDFDPGGGDMHTSNGELDISLSKFDSLGNFEWARTWGGSDNDRSQGVAVDSSGNVYVTGWFNGTVDFDPDGGDVHTSNGLWDVFLSKFDSSGSFEWARTWGGAGSDGGCGIAVDDYGNVYITGRFNKTVDFDPDGGDPHTGSYDVFLSKFDSSGNFEWAQTWGGSEFDSGYEAAVDSSGNIYVTGVFYGTTDFDPDGGNPHTSNGYADAFLSKFDSSGNFEWVRTWGGPESTVGIGIATDSYGNVYVTGYFKNTVNFDTSCGNQYTSNGHSDVYLSKVNLSGELEWVRTWGGASHDCGSEVAIDCSGNIYVSGDFAWTTDFDIVGGDSYTSNGLDDAFLSKFDSSGNLEWARTWGGSEWDDGLEVATDISGNIYVTGYFWSIVDFAPTDHLCNEYPDEHTSNGRCDVFLIKFLPDGCW